MSVSVVVDHLNEVKFVVLFFVHEAGTHVHKVNLAAFETNEFLLHVEVFKESELVVLE